MDRGAAARGRERLDGQIFIYEDDCLRGPEGPSRRGRDVLHSSTKTGNEERGGENELVAAVLEENLCDISNSFCTPTRLSNARLSPRFATPRTSNNSKICPFCAVDRQPAAAAESSPGRGAVRMLQSVIHDLEAKLKDRDSTIEELRMQLSLQKEESSGRSRPRSETAPSAPVEDAEADRAYTGRATITFMQDQSNKQQLYIALRGVRDVGFTEYKIITSYRHDPLNPSGGKRIVWHRYSHFAKLHASLTSKGLVLPRLPRKHLFLSHTSAVIKEREAGLLAILNTMARDPSIVSLAEVQKFLGLKGWLDEEQVPMPRSRPLTHTKVDPLNSPASSGVFRCL